MVYLLVLEVDITVILATATPVKHCQMTKRPGTKFLIGIDVTNVSIITEVMLVKDNT
jgi:23S rRNA U2552 (ribose-2'-O)-methylase RlmE/FtsJ